jgi:hypothetical protein
MRDGGPILAEFVDGTQSPGASPAPSPTVVKR